MVAITQRNLVFAHVLSMRSIKSFEATLDLEEADLPPKLVRYLVAAAWYGDHDRFTCTEP
jgi:hypothetical protein